MKHILIICLLFFSVYYPPILNFNITYITGGISILGILYFGLKDKKFIIPKYISNLYMYMLFFFLYLGIISFIHSNSILNACKNTLFWSVSIIPTGIFISTLINKLNITNINKYVLDIFFLIGIIQSILAIISFFYSDFQNWTIMKMIEYGFSESRFTQLSVFRWYGFAGKVGYTMPILQMVLAMLSFYKGIFENKKYLIVFPFFIFSSLINARTPIVFLIIGLFLIFIKFIIDRKIKIIFNVIICMLSLLIFFILLNQFELLKTANLEWIKDGINELLKIITFDNLSDIYYFSPINYKLPSGLDIFCGIGQYTGTAIGYATDIGYVNDIYLGGIIYLIIILLFFMYILKHICIRNNYFSKFMYQLIIICLLIGNIKGYIFSFNELTSFIIIYSILVELNIKKHKNNVPC